MNYIINITAFATVLVKNASNPDEAMTAACDWISLGDLQLDEGSIGREVKDEDLKNEERHADQTFTMTND